MRTIFLVIAAGGEYSDHWSQPIKAFTAEMSARAEITRLEGVTDELRKLKRYPSWDMWTEFRKLGISHSSPKATEIREQWTVEYNKLTAAFALACEKADIPLLLMQDSNLHFGCDPLPLVEEDNE